MESQRAEELVRQSLAELKTLVPDTDNVQYKTWKLKTKALLRQVYGESHFLSLEFENLSWWISVDHLEREWFEKGRTGATSVLETALYELQVLSQPAVLPSSDSVDPDLWAHVAKFVEEEDWSSLPSAVEIFVESKIRTWAGRPRSEVGVALMSSVFSPKSGEFPLGQAEGEREAWHVLARGFAGALSNVDRHQIQERADLKRYAVGVLGLGSLLLTQLRWEHEHRLRPPPTRAKAE